MIAHVCHQCGTDLARQRAAREPRYGLWLVTCPTCNKHHTRRHSTPQRRMDHFMRLDTALRVLVLQTIMLAFFIATGFFSALGLRYLYETWSRDDLPNAAQPLAILCAVIYPLALGTWLVMSFRPRSVVKIFLTWSLMWISFAAVVTIGLWMSVNPDDSLRLVGSRVDFSEMNVAEEFGAIGAQVAIQLAITLALVVVATSGTIPALLLRSSFRTLQRWRWRLRKKHRRRKRVSL